MWVGEGAIVVVHSRKDKEWGPWVWFGDFIWKYGAISGKAWRKQSVLCSVGWWLGPVGGGAFWNHSAGFKSQFYHLPPGAPQIICFTSKCFLNCKTEVIKAPPLCHLMNVKLRVRVTVAFAFFCRAFISTQEFPPGSLSPSPFQKCHWFEVC